MTPYWLLAAVLLPVLGAAQQPVAPPLPGLIVRLRTKSGATAFPLGTRIQLVVSFQASIPGRYSFGLSDGRRVQGCSVSKPVVSPDEGWHDPLAALHRTGNADFGTDCMLRLGQLTMQETDQTLELNQWVRFDQPGSYTVTVRNQGIILDRRGGEHLDVMSEPLRLTLTAQPPGWYDAELARMTSELTVNLARDNTASNADLNAAVQALASLGGPRAARALDWRGTPRGFAARPA